MVKDGYKITDIGVIPKDWENKDISSICKNIIDYRGVTPKKKGMEWGNGNIVALSAGNVKKGYIDFNAECYLGSEELYKKWMRNGDSQKNDIAFTMEAPLGNVALIPDNEKYILSQRTILLQVDRELYDPKYIFQVLLSEKFQNYIKSSSTGSTAQGIKRKIFEKLYLSIPFDLNEQKAIAKALSDTDELIDSLEDLIEKKENIKLGTMQQLFKLKKYKEVDIGTLCKSFTKQTGFDYSASIKPSLIQSNKTGYVPFIQNKDFKGKFINFDTDYFVPEKIANNFPRILLNERCLLISISGAIGNLAVFHNHQKAFIGGAVAVGKFKNKDLLDWVMYYLLSERGQEKLLINVKAGSHQNLILDDIKKILIPIPSEQEYKNIVAILSDMDKEIEVLKQKLKKTKAIKEAMMDELLTGKTRLIKG